MTRQQPRWRLLDTAGCEGDSAAEGLAFDEALLAPYDRGAAPDHAATLRLYRYRPHCALVGRYQSVEDEVDLGYCAHHGVDVSRRPTGGGAILMGPGQLGVALAMRATGERSPRQELRRFSAGVAAGLAALGVEARFRGKNDLRVAARKIAGLGLYLDPHGGLLLHASVLLDLDVALMLRVLTIPGAPRGSEGQRRVAQRITTVRRELDTAVTIADLVTDARRALAEGFSRTLGVTLEASSPTPLEVERRQQLIESRYGDQGWIHQPSPRADRQGAATLRTPGGLLRIHVGVHGHAIKSALISGSFNQLPAGLARFESALKWCQATPESITACARESLAAGDLGVSAETVATAVWRAASRGLRLARRSYPARAAGSCYFPEPPTAAGGARATAEGDMP